MDYKKALNRVSLVFVALVLFFTFFSQTLADLRMPLVTLSFARAGSIGSEAFAAGIVEHATVETIFAPVSGTVVHLAERGSRFWADGALFAIYTDFESLREQILRTQHDRNILALNAERVNNERALLQQQIARVVAEAPAVPALVGYELQAVGVTDRLDAARAGLATQETMYAQGLVPRHTVTERENAVRALELELQGLHIRQEAALEAQAEHTASQHQARTAQLQQLEGGLSQLDVQLRIHAAEDSSLERRMEDLLAQLDEGEYFEVIRGSLEVLSAAPGLVAGARVSEGAPIMTVAHLDNNFLVQVSFDARHYFLQAGSVVEVVVGDLRFDTLVDRVFSEGGQNTAVIEISDRQLSGGELARVRLRAPARHFANILPRSAVREDAFGYYVLTVTAEERMFGVSYFADMVRVEEVFAWDNQNAAVMFLTDVSEPVIVNSDAPVYSGERVRPVDGGDSFGLR